MHSVEDLEIGLMFWAGNDGRETLRWVKNFGLRAGQLGFHGELPLETAGPRWRDALAEQEFLIATAMASYSGEDYSNILSVQRTVGLVPQSTRDARIARTKAVADLASALGIQSIACHIGFVPHNRGDSVYKEVCEVTRYICDYCRSKGQVFALETGQEPAKVLLHFIEDVARPNLKVNFDPANMILYGTGDPLEALEVLQSHIISVHCKDADWPPLDSPASLGRECALGTGSVDVPAFISKLKQIRYVGILSIEREEPDETTREVDIRNAISLLKQLTGRP